MRSWRSVVGRLLDWLLNRIAWSFLALRHWIGRPPRVQIVTYDGYVSRGMGLVRGRVVEDEGGGDGVVRRILAKLKRGEIPRAVVRVRYPGGSCEVVADTQGHVRVDVPLRGRPTAGGGWAAAHLELAGAPVPLREREQVRACEMLMVPGTATFGILSDIDDTVIRSRSGNKLAMAELVLPQSAQDREVVAGVPELYRALQGGVSGSDGNPFFYHSSASWNTYEHLHRFLDQEGIPRGPMFLRQYTAQKLMAGGDVEHKRAVMDEVLNAFADLPFLLLGDGAGDDPEAYLEVARRHGTRIRAVYLRRSRDTQRNQRVEGVVGAICDLGVEALLVESSDEIARYAEAGWQNSRSQRHGQSSGAGKTS